MTDEVVLILFGFLLGLLGTAVASLPGWIRRKKLEGRLKALATLFREGVSIRNRANFQDMPNQDLHAWNSRREAWHSKMMEKANAISEHKAVHIDTLGTFPIQNWPGVTNQVQLIRVSELSATLDRLRSFMLAIE